MCFFFFLIVEEKKQTIPLSTLVHSTSPYIPSTTYEKSREVPVWDIHRHEDSDSEDEGGNSRWPDDDDCWSEYDNCLATLLTSVSATLKNLGHTNMAMLKKKQDSTSFTTQSFVTDYPRTS